MYLSLIDVPAAPSTPQVWFLTKCYNKVDWSGCSRLLREKRVQGRPRRCKPRRLPGPPAESECLERKLTPKWTNHKKTVGKHEFSNLSLG
ncbi:UNVERIFIED_CONTAM: hypothetical protein FO527_26900 [Bacillus sp. ATCC 13368]